MIDDILVQIFGEMTLGRLGHSRRAQLLFRLFFGLLGAGLGAFGAVYLAREESAAVNRAMHASMVAVFVFLACFFLFNVALGRKWKWPGLGFVASFVAVFVTRIALGP
jgi:hypothetical protein